MHNSPAFYIYAFIAIVYLFKAARSSEKWENILLSLAYFSMALLH